MSNQPWFGEFNALRSPMSPREIRDVMQRELADCGVRLDPELLPQQPFLLPESSYQELFNSAFALLRLLKKAVQHAGDTREARLAALGADESAYPVFTGDEEFEDRYSDLMARPDVVIGPDGPKFVEFNVSGTFGGTTETHVFSRIWHQVYGDRARSGFWGFDSYEARVKALQSVLDELGVDRAVAVLGSRRDIPNATSNRYYDREIQLLRQNGIRATFFEPEELLDGLGLPGALRYPVGLRYFNVMDWQAHGIDFAPVRTAVEAGWQLVPSQSCGMIANKKVLAWVSSGQPWMSDTEREIAERYLPWTREVKPGEVVWQGRPWSLSELLLANPENFVLKKSIGMMGLEVLIGRTADADTWSRTVREALAEGDSIVQEYVEPAHVPMVLGNGSPDGSVTVSVAPVFSPCLYGTNPGGCLVRFFPDGSSDVVSAWGHGALENVAMAVGGEHRP
ncbi:hypothetical protein [Streptomyces sp. YGL11-2]|uniref:hypothetical protein n=1 Tax=Streptomyces sp. YGL11-2 TaxID=3414028 RepID=UPI003CF9EAF2